MVSIYFVVVVVWMLHVHVFFPLFPFLLVCGSFFSSSSGKQAVARVCASNRWEVERGMRMCSLTLSEFHAEIRRSHLLMSSSSSSVFLFCTAARQDPAASWRIPKKEKKNALSSSFPFFSFCVFALLSVYPYCGQCTLLTVALAMKPGMRVENRETMEAPAPQQPVKSGRGGYLRCPFDIDSAFAAMAELNAAGGALGHKTHRPHAVSGSGAGNDGENDEDDVCRPWNRAGVGAKALSAKERRSQQQDAERIYGSMAACNVDEITGDASTAPDKGLAVALSTWEKTALQRVLPRGVLKRKRQRNNENCGEEAVDGEGCNEVGRQQRQNNVLGRRREGEERSLSAGFGDSHRKTGGDQNENVHPREFGGSYATRKTEEQSRTEKNKPINRLQRLDAMRNAALFGKKK
ncbi:hypothetical protein C3747_41g306 [Trypanosoma cruzi]|uniref:Uncharacterized protein n=2 Tax=Trypanosoma cruzi TaxID=5693 RepID=Q4DEU7_TRYCC|nr:hypothetical protein, conserved [Trypanosoma cruzi]EAN91050.1 hypothetical protein, conserved [Trypanosoma cruzi]PWV13672.1 hypothetical protein C3747_41g306 [Trypanosoma cruzi]|eukprot:XP_812901.1 hypothetical protein [Trypanosoma cruzi strain CL Brener]